jgi:hypothetical protein
MANEITVAGTPEFVLTEAISEILYRAAYTGVVVKPFVRQESLEGIPTIVKQLSKSPLLSAGALTPGTDVVASAFDPTSVDVTVAEIGLMIMPLDLLIESSIVGLDYYVEQLGLALATKEDTDLLANNTSFTQVVGSTGVNMTETNFLDAIFELRNGNAMGPFWCCLAPIQLRDLQVAVATSAAPLWGASEGQKQLIADAGFFFGVPVITSTNVPTANAAADRAGVMAPMGQGCGIAYVSKRGARIEAQRDASQRGVELVATMAYGTGIGNTAANGGVEMTTDA